MADLETHNTASIGPHVVAGRLFFKMPDGLSIDAKISEPYASQIVEMWRGEMARPNYCPCVNGQPDPCPACGATISGNDPVRGFCQARFKD
jgi:hypothetical protein